MEQMENKTGHTGTKAYLGNMGTPKSNKIFLGNTGTQGRFCWEQRTMVPSPLGGLHHCSKFGKGDVSRVSPSSKQTSLSVLCTRKIKIEMA